MAKQNGSRLVRGIAAGVARPGLAGTARAVGAGVLADGAGGQCSQVHEHGKPTLTVIFYRFNETPVGRMAKTGYHRFPGTAGRRSDRIASGAITTDRRRLAETIQISPYGPAQW